MFEFEIMVTGYTIVVATTTVVISKCIGNKKLAFFTYVMHKRKKLRPVIFLSNKQTLCIYFDH